MAIINIGRFGQGPSKDLAFDYDRVGALTIPAAGSQQRPQYRIELSGKGAVCNLYALGAVTYEKLKQILINPPVNARIVPGLELLGVRIQYQPQGWDSETMGSLVVRRVPGIILELAQAGFPDKQRPLYPFPEKAGIEVLDLSPSNSSVHYTSYTALDEIALHKNTVRVSFQKVKEARAFTELSVLTASENLAARLAATICHRTSRRLMINTCVTGMILGLANGTTLRLGICADLAKKPTVK